MTILIKKADFIKSCRGKSWLVRLPIIAYLAYIFFKHVAEPNYLGFLHNFNLLMHEAGHVFFMPFGDLMQFNGGTYLQLAIPVICLVVFLKNADYFGATFSLGWLSDNLFNVAMYVNDARSRILPLLGDDISSHDWHNILGRLDLLDFDHDIAYVIRILAIFSMSMAILFGSYILTVMYRNPIDKVFTPRNVLRGPFGDK